MRYSGFDFAGSKSPSRSVGFDAIFTQPTQPARIVDSSYSFAAGAIYSTVGDLYRYNKALQAGKLISPDSMKKAFTPVLQQYGYGWSIDSVPGMRVIEHQGAIPGFLTIMAMIPETQTCIILLSNSRDPDVVIPDTYMGLLKVLMGWPYVLPRLAIQLAADSLMAYKGDYELTDNKSFKGHLTLEEGQLLLQWNTNKPEDLFAERQDSFFIKSYDLQLVFTRNTAGKISGFTAYSGGKSYVYQKINTP